MSRAEQALAGPISEAEVARLRRHLKEAANGCWDSDLPAKSNGYRTFTLRRDGHGVTVHVHRLVYRVFHGKAPGDSFVMHSCDNPGCCNPAHLSLGSHQDNMDDMVSKGRTRRVFSDAVVSEIRAANEPLVVLAARFGCSAAHIWRIKNVKVKTLKLAGLVPVRLRPKRVSGVLDEALVREIRASKETSYRLGARLGVSDSLIRQVRRRKVWAHVQDVDSQQSQESHA